MRPGPRVPAPRPGARPPSPARSSSPRITEPWLRSAWKRPGKQDRTLSSRLSPAKTPRQRLSTARRATLGGRMGLKPRSQRRARPCRGRSRRHRSIPNPEPRGRRRVERERPFPDARPRCGAGAGVERALQRPRREGLGPPAVSPQGPGVARQNCAQSRRGLRPGVRPAPSAQPKAELWRRGRRAGGGPCTGEGAVRRGRAACSAPFPGAGAGGRT